MHFQNLLASNNIMQSDNIIVSMDNIIVVHNGNNLYLSIDGGKSYYKSIQLPDIGILNYVHVFQSTYDLLICTAQTCYYSTDWEQLNESTVLDVDGNTFIPASEGNFTCETKTTKRQIIGETEILCWGNYSTVGGIEYDNINIWYTVDCGQTIKSCFKFGVSIPDNESGPLPTRHVHSIDFNPVDETFWCQTGDEPTTTYSHWLKGAYNLVADTWTWTLIGSGDAFKTNNMVFAGGYAYTSWDIVGGGVKKCLYSDMGDTLEHEQILNAPNDCCGVFVGERGDILAVITFWGGNAPARNLYYSPDGINFNLIVGEIPSEYDEPETGYYSLCAPNNQGKILAAIYPSDMEIGVWDRKPSVWLDDMIKRAGFPDAFKPLS